MKYQVTHSTKYTYSDAVPVCHNLVHLAPRALPRQRCDEFRLLVHPEPQELAHRVDYFGNQACYFSIEYPHRGLTITATSSVEVEPPLDVDPERTTPWEQLAETLSRAPGQQLGSAQFALLSPLTGAWEQVRPYALESFRPGRPALAALLDLTTRIHADFTYDPQATTVSTPVGEVFQQRRGVCQDFAHLQISCLRSLGLAARYVSGYLRTAPPPGKPRLVGADASHAWVSLDCGPETGWIDVDPTNNRLVSTDHITVAWGRDYQDVCPVQGVIVGGGEHKLDVSVDVAHGG